MKKTLRDFSLILVFGVVSIALVVASSQFFSPSNGGYSPEMSGTINGSIEKLKEELINSDKAFSRKLRALDNTVHDLQNRVDELERTFTLGRKTDSSPAIKQKSRYPSDNRQHGSSINPSQPKADFVQNSLSRAWLYLAEQKYDPGSHDRVLSDLVAAYRIKGLSRNTNASLLNTIHQINELGLNQVVKEASLLPPNEAVRHLRSFLRNTPRLSKEQKLRIKGVIAGYSAVR